MWPSSPDDGYLVSPDVGIWHVWTQPQLGSVGKASIKGSTQTGLTWLTYCHWHSFFVMLNLRIEIHSYNMRKKRSVKGQEPPALQKWVKMNSSCDLSGPSWTSTERNNIQNFCSLNGLRYQLLLASWSHKCVKSISSVAILLLLANRYSLTVNKPLFKVS